MFAGLGAFGLLVRFWYAVFAAEGPRPASTLWRVVAVPAALLLVLLHIVAAPLLLTVRVSEPYGPRALVDEMSLTVPLEETIEEKDLVVVNHPPSPMLAGYCLLHSEHQGMPVPRALRTLAPGIAPVRVRRTDEWTLEVEPLAGYLIVPDRLFRNENSPLHPGEQVHLERMTATVLSVEHGRPKNVAFRFETPLEDSSLCWVRFQAGEFVPWTPPPVGGEVTLRPQWRPEFW